MPWWSAVFLENLLHRWQLKYLAFVTFHVKLTIGGADEKNCCECTIAREANHYKLIERIDGTLRSSQVVQCIERIMTRLFNRGSGTVLGASRVCLCLSVTHNDPIYLKIKIFCSSPSIASLHFWPRKVKAQGQGKCRDRFLALTPPQGGEYACCARTADCSVITSDKGGGINVFAFNCLPVCMSVSKITQKRVHEFGWNVACRQMSGYGRTG